jgi:hypothetical protein
LSYLSLAFSFRPQFQRLLKIQHRFGAGRAESRRGGALRRGAPRGIERAVCKRFRIEMRPELNRDYQVEN